MNDRQQYAYKFYLSRGYTPAQAAGIVGGLRGETADLNTSQVHDNGIGYGIAGWNGPRLAALRQMYGDKAGELDNQLAFVDHELRTSEGKAYGALQAAQTPEDAGNAMLAFFRPSNWNVPGAHPERARYAAQIFSGQGGTVADNGGQQPQMAAQRSPIGEVFTNFASTLPAPLTNQSSQDQVPASIEGENPLTNPVFQPRAFQLARLTDRFARRQT